MALTEATIAKMAVAGITGALNLGGGIIQQSMSNKATERANEQARKWQLEDRLHDEAYNNPVAQAFRLRQAGIGGDYSNIVSSGQTKSNTAPVQVPEQVMNLNSIGTAGLDAYNQIRTTDADIAVSKAQAELYGAQKHKVDVDTALAEIDLKYRDQEKQLNLAHESGELAFLKVQTDNVELRNSLQRIENEIAADTMQAQKDMVNLGAENLRIENNKLYWEMQGVKYEVEVLKPLEAAQQQKLIDYYQKLIDKTDVDIQKIQKEIDLMSYEEQIYTQQLILNGPNEQLAEAYMQYLDKNPEQAENLVKSRIKSERFDNNLVVKALGPITNIVKSTAFAVGGIGAFKGVSARSSATGGWTSSYSR